MSEPAIGGRRPIVVEVEPSTVYWCSCGHSENQPYCDGAHAGRGMAPVAVEITEKQRIAWCTCKRSTKGHICDGAHKCLPPE